MEARDTDGDKIGEAATLLGGEATIAMLKEIKYAMENVTMAVEV